MRVVIGVMCAVLLETTAGFAQFVVPDGAPGATSSLAFDGPPPPALPAIVSRDAEGRATVRAVRLSQPLRVDGRLDEEVYTTVTPISDFIQTEPTAGAPASERTDVWLWFDDDNFYVTVRAWESQPDRMIAEPERRRLPPRQLHQHERVNFGDRTRAGANERADLAVLAIPERGVADRDIPPAAQVHVPERGGH